MKISLKTDNWDFSIASKLDHVDFLPSVGTHIEGVKGLLPGVADRICRITYDAVNAGCGLSDTSLSDDYCARFTITFNKISKNHTKELDALITGAVYSIRQLA